MSETEEKTEPVIPQPEIILLGGSKDGLVTSYESGLKSVQNVQLNDEFTGPKYVDLYEATNLRNREGKTIFVNTGRYNEEESKEFWESLDAEQVASFVTRAKEEKAAEDVAAEEAAIADAVAVEAAAQVEAEKEKVEAEVVEAVESAVETTEETSEKESE